MEDRLILGIPDDEAATAPKRRFELAERGALTGARGLPLVLLAGFGWAAQILFGAETSEEGPASGKAEHAENHAVQQEEDSATVAPEPEDATIAKIYQIAKYLQEMAEPVKEFLVGLWRPVQP